MGNNGHIITKAAHDIGVRQELEHGRVIILKDGVPVIDMPWEMVDDFCKAMRLKKLLCEEYANREQLAQDSAILLRAGAQMALSARQDVKDEAAKRAVHDRELRRSNLKGITSGEAFGHPVIEVRPPKPKTEEQP